MGGNMDKYTPIVFFSGLDRTGKTTTRKEFARLTGEKYITFERSPIDNIVYDEYFRGIMLTGTELQDIIMRFSYLDNVYVVRLILSFDEINKRAEETEGIRYPINELEGCSELFEKYFEIAQQLGINIINVTCDGKSINEIANEIYRKIK